MTGDSSGRPSRTRRASRFVSTELRAIRALRARLGVRAAIVERVRYNLELGLDEAKMSALASDLAATRAGLSAAQAQIESVVAYLELARPGAPEVASPSMVERIVALQAWLAHQPPSDATVSVIIPTRSRPALVSEAIASVQAQSHPNWELIVVDDGSVDETQATLAAVGDDRVRAVRTQGLGSAGARSVGLAHARGDAIAYLDDDNIMLPGWLAGVAWALSRFDDVDVVYGARVVEDMTHLTRDARLPRLLFRQFDRDRLLDYNYIDASVIAHRAGLREARWDPELSGIADWDLMIRLTEEKPALALPVVAALYRTEAPDRQTGSSRARAAEQKLRARLAANSSRIA
jgi:hypothetical protein